MSPAEEPPQEHQVGITNAQEGNPDAEISRLTQEMNTLFAAKRYAEAARVALSITAMSKDELRQTFERHGVTILHLDHEAFGIYRVIEPSYDLRVDGGTPKVLAAATEFGKRHAQEAVLVARKLQEGESDPVARMGLTVTLNAQVNIDEAVRIAEAVRKEGFAGATFLPKMRGTLTIFHTEDLGMTPERFQDAAATVLKQLMVAYPALSFEIERFIIHMPSP